MSDKISAIIDKILKSDPLKKIESKLVYKTLDGNYKLFGKYNIKHVDDTYVLTVKDTHTVKIFLDLRNAVTWATLDKNNKITETIRVLELDSLLAGTKEHIKLYERLSSKVKKTEEKILYSTKLTECLYKKKKISDELDKYVQQCRYWQTLDFNKSTVNYLR
jgi:hypothetical protein